MMAAFAFPLVVLKGSSPDASKLPLHPSANSKDKG
jgi:hypothetical protein